MNSVTEGRPGSAHQCSFCGKSRRAVRKLVAGPRVSICDECVELCMVIVREGGKSFYLRTPDEYRKLAADDVRAAETAGIPSDKALLAVGRTWLRLAEEAENAEASQPAAKPQPSQPTDGEDEAGEPAKAEPSEAAAKSERGGAPAKLEQSEEVAKSDQNDAVQILISLANLASPSQDKPD